MTNNNDDKDYDDFIRRVLNTSADKFLDNLKEDERLSVEDIEDRCTINEHKRGEKTKDCLHKAEMIIIWGVFIAIMALGFTYVWHLVTPWDYLSEDQIEKINTILSSAILASVLSSRFKRYFS